MIGLAGRAPRLALWTTVATVATVLAAAAPGADSPSTGSACGFETRPPARFAHVIWIWMENRAYGQIIGSPAAPYLNALADECGLATNYRAVTHPSLPNYIAATSGGTWRISDDNGPSSHPLAVRSIFSQARSSASYEESMPSACDLVSTGSYAVKHNPEAYYTPIRAACASDDLPLGSGAGGGFLAGLASGKLPAFSFVTPNLCDDMHDCPVQSGDRWLATWVAKIVASPTYRAGRTVIFITWDEDDGSSNNHVPTLIVSPSTKPGTRDGGSLTHYSLLRTTEELLGLSRHLGLAARAPSMRAAFNL